MSVGVETFESTFEKLQHATNATQKDKVETDLKVCRVRTIPILLSPVPYFCLYSSRPLHIPEYASLQTGVG